MAFCKVKRGKRASCPKKEKSRILLRLNGDEIVYAFTQTLRRVTRPTIDRCSNRVTSKISLPTLNEQRNCWV